MSDSITLPSPVTGDQTDIYYQMSVHVNGIGEVLITKDSAKYGRTILRYGFTNLTQDQKDGLEYVLTNYRGHKLTVTDHLDVEWTCYLISEPYVFTETICHRYNINLTFLGTKND